jgi:hypothetical protein
VLPRTRLYAASKLERIGGGTLDVAGVVELDVTIVELMPMFQSDQLIATHEGDTSHADVAVERWTPLCANANPTAVGGTFDAHVIVALTRRTVMRTITKTLSIIAFGAAISAPHAARADDPPSAYSYAWHDSRLRSDFGVSAILGGGLTGFTDKSMRDTMANSVGGLWDLRVTLGSHTPLALDLGYIGTAGKINALTGAKSGTLIGTTAEAALRFNILPHSAWNPYAFAGIGWQRYDVTGATFTTADTGLNSSDNSIVYPMGAGIAYRHPSGLAVDAHGTFRANTNYGLVLDRVGGNSYAPMHAWEASAAAGYEF